MTWSSSLVSEGPSLSDLDWDVELISIQEIIVESVVF